MLTHTHTLRARYASDAALVLTTIIWGSTFILAKDVLSQWTPLAYISVRFAIATFALAALFPGELKSATKSEWRAGAILGALVGGGFAVQAVGQVYTSATKSAFITAFTTPLVPLVAYIFFRTRPGIENLIGVVIATVGGMILLLPSGSEPQAGSDTMESMFAAINVGDGLTFCCTLLFATHIVLLGFYTRKFAARRLTVSQITAATIGFIAVFGLSHAAAWAFGANVLPSAIAREIAPLVWSASIAWQLIYLGVIGTVAAFLLWTWGQARTTATHAAIIFTLEPVFATLFAVLLRGRSEWLGGWASLGALLILCGVLISEAKLKRGTSQDAAA